MPLQPMRQATQHRYPIPSLRMPGLGAAWMAAEGAGVVATPRDEPGCGLGVSVFARRHAGPSVLAIGCGVLDCAVIAANPYAAACGPVFAVDPSRCKSVLI